MTSIRKQLLAIFAGEEPEYDRAAALGTRALPALRAIVETDPKHAASAVYVAGLIGSREALDILAWAARGDDSRLRLHTAGALGEFINRARSCDERDAAWEILASLLDDPSKGVRRFAGRAAADLPDYAQHAGRDPG
jgi:HEAT repeat protein